MHRLLRSKVFIGLIVIITLLVVFGNSIKEDSKLYFLKNIVSVPLTPFQKAYTFVGDKIGDVSGYFRDLDTLRSEKEELIKRIEYLENTNYELERYKRENENLRELLSIKDSYTAYRQLGANIIAKDPGNWFNSFTIDIGMADKVNTTFPVITNRGLVGKVVNSQLNSSTVQTIIDYDSAVSARLSDTHDLVIVRGDLELKSKGLCKMEFTPVDIDINIGDKLETSGLGGIYPKGILIGEVFQIVGTPGDKTSYVIVKPYVDFKRLEEVVVLIYNEQIDKEKVSTTNEE